MLVRECTLADFSKIEKFMSSYVVGFSAPKNLSDVLYLQGLSHSIMLLVENKEVGGFVLAVEVLAKRPFLSKILGEKILEIKSFIFSPDYWKEDILKETLRHLLQKARGEFFSGIIAEVPVHCTEVLEFFIKHGMRIYEAIFVKPTSKEKISPEFTEIPFSEISSYSDLNIIDSEASEKVLKNNIVLVSQRESSKCILVSRKDGEVVLLMCSEGAALRGLLSEVLKSLSRVLSFYGVRRIKIRCLAEKTFFRRFFLKEGFCLHSYTLYLPLTK
ncbi:MAG: hypothetical protein DRJ52_07555 [Thermoprotei archaeon]|nr:MAG: hypothetical protein DRJ52_07555 [Thermoprotei archaeon]